jgi:hypothetical protein
MQCHEPETTTTSPLQFLFLLERNIFFSVERLNLLLIHWRLSRRKYSIVIAVQNQQIIGRFRYQPCGVSSRLCQYQIIQNIRPARRLTSQWQRFVSNWKWIVKRQVILYDICISEVCRTLQGRTQENVIKSTLIVKFGRKKDFTIIVRKSLRWMNQTR